MASEALVESEIEGGLNLVKMLDESDFKVKAALWVYYSDQERWRFVIASEGGEKEIGENYLKISTLMAKSRSEHPDTQLLSLDKVKLTGVMDPIISGLRPVVRIEGLGGVRFSHDVINGVYLEDALVHRMAA